MKKALNRCSRIILVCAVLCSSAGFAAGSGDGLPEVLYADWAEDPIWVRADRAFTPSGEVAEDVFREEVRAILAQYLAYPPEGDCIHIDQHVQICGMRRVGRESLTSSLHDSDWVVRARVTGRAGGYWSATPGTLVEAVPVETLKGPANRQGPHYFFMPVGTVDAGRTKFCKKQGFYADLPEVGDEVLLLVSLRGATRDGLVLTDGESGIITLHTNGKASLPGMDPRREEVKGLISNEDVLRRVVQILREDP